MTERFPGKPRALKTEEAIELHHGSLEEKSLAEEVLALEGLQELPPEQWREKLRELAGRVAELTEKSRTDRGTGLLNMHGFLEEVHQLEAVFARERGKGRIEIPTALLSIDLDGFKEVNDTGGHALGDLCLKLIADNVKRVLREADIFARIGGDEFSIYLSEVDEKGALKVAKKVRSVIEGVVQEEVRRELPSYEGKISASIGIVVLDGDGTVEGEDVSLEKKMNYADYAAYVVKAAGKGGELTLHAAREVDSDGKFEKDFLTGKTLPR